MFSPLTKFHGCRSQASFSRLTNCSRSSSNTSSRNKNRCGFLSRTQQLRVVKATATPRNLSEPQGQQGPSAEVIPGSLGEQAWAMDGGVSPSSLLLKLDAFVRFTRPHTMIGTAISICSVSSLALSSLTDLNTRFFLGLLQALLPALLMNVFIVGLNQLTDIEIDKVNKPSLPLASGDFSPAEGSAIVAASAAASLALGFSSSSAPLLATLLVSMALGTAYSLDLPFLRWKRFPFLAASCILAVRAVVVQLGFYLHMQTAVFGRPPSLSHPPLLFATGFMCFFSIVIALFKDIPDVAGDRVFGIKSLSVRMGQEKVYWLCISLLLLAYSSSIPLSLSSSTLLWSKVATISTHTMAAILLWRRASDVDFSRPDSISSVYMFVWKLFYLEYLLLPLMR